MVGACVVTSVFTPTRGKRSNVPRYLGEPRNDDALATLAVLYGARDGIDPFETAWREYEGERLLPLLATDPRLGDAPAVPGQRVSVPLTVDGQLQTPDAFARIECHFFVNGGFFEKEGQLIEDVDAIRCGLLSRQTGVTLPGFV